MPSQGYLSIGAVQPGTTTGTSLGRVSIGAVQAPAYAFTSTGGASLQGSSAWISSYQYLASGSVVASGSASTVLTYLAYATGGLQSGGSAATLTGFAVSASGGLFVNGSSSSLFTLTWAASGGIALGGQSVFNVSMSLNAVGGVIVGGQSASQFKMFATSIGGMYIAGVARTRVFAEGDLPGAMQVAWAAAGLDQSVGPLYYDQAPRGAQVPYVVFNESLNVPHYTMGTGYWEDQRLRFQVIAHQEAEVNKFGLLVESRLSSYVNGQCMIPNHAQGAPFSAVFYRRQTIRPAAPWSDGRPRAIRVMMMRVRTARARSL